MKTKILIGLIAVGLSTFDLTSCTNSDKDKTTKKELELQKRELYLKQKELELKEKELALDGVYKSKFNKTKVTATKNQTQPEKQITLPHKTVDAKKQIVGQMVKDGQLDQSCINDFGIEEAIGFESVALSKNGKQYLLSGGKCGFGARTSMYWVYEIKNEKTKMLAILGASDNVKVTSQRTNGYFNIETGSYYGGSVHYFRYKYNGNEYKQQVDYERVEPVD